MLDVPEEITVPAELVRLTDEGGMLAVPVEVLVKIEVRVVG